MTGRTVGWCAVVEYGTKTIQQTKIYPDRGGAEAAMRRLGPARDGAVLVELRTPDNNPQEDPK